MYKRQFLDHAANKKADVVRMYLPPDANCLLSCFDHCIKSRNYVNIIVASKHPRPQWLTMEQAVKHCSQGIGIWSWASNDQGQEPDVVMACCGDTPTLETLAAVSILRRELPELKLRVVNVVDLMKLQPHTEHPHGLTDEEYDGLFTQDKPIIFAYHGYPTLVHELTYRRHNRNLHVRGYKEEGTCLLYTSWCCRRASFPDISPQGAGCCRSGPAPCGRSQGSPDCARPARVRAWRAIRPPRGRPRCP